MNPFKTTRPMEPPYYDKDCNRVTLDQLCRLDPEWASNEIRALRQQLREVVTNQVRPIQIVMREGDKLPPHLERAPRSGDTLPETGDGGSDGSNAG